MKFFKVLVPGVIGVNPFDYQCQDLGDLNYSIGDIVRVPFRKKVLHGIIWCQISQSDLSSSVRLKEIIPDTEDAEMCAGLKSASCSNLHQNCSSKANTLSPSEVGVSDRFNIGEGSIKLIKLASSYYLAELGSFAKLVLPVDIYEKPIKYLQQDISGFNTSGKGGVLYKLKNLDVEQNRALEKIIASEKPILLNGITGSGKTEIYFHYVARMINEGKQSLIMLPEIAILKQIAKRFEDTFGFSPAIWHSGITKARKKPIIRGIIKGDVKVVIGTRSSLFLPYQNLGAVIVDEEHDVSYKQSENIRYHARDMAVLKAKLENASVLLLSATPSIESIHNASEGKYELIRISSRFNEATLPDIEIIDMRREDLPKNMWISKPLHQAIKQNLKLGHQSMIFLNRRGYAPLTLCRNCGYRFECNNCSSFLVLHKKLSRMQCHHCGQIREISTDCPDCGSDNISFSGPGIERVAEELLNIFPEARISMLSRSESSSKDDTVNITLTDMLDGKVDILIGTQIITKGYHFPKLTIVGIIDADMGLSGTDFRSSERSFQLLHQVGGRAGREQLRGVVYIQTYNPESNLIKALSSNNMDDFINYELQSRKSLLMPPFGKMAAIYFSGKNELLVHHKILELARNAPQSNARILGPVPANLYKVAGNYRYQILVISNREFNIQKYVTFWLSAIKIPSSIRVKIDIDPQSFL